MNQNEHKPDLSQIDLEGALKNLPERRAPSNLLPCVMEQIRRREVQSNSAGWGHWPMRLRLFSACLGLLILIAGVLWGLRIWQLHLEPVLARLSTVFQAVYGALESIPAKILGIESGVGLQLLNYGPMVLGALLLVIYLTFIGLGSAAYRTFRKIQL